LPPFILWASGASLIWITTASAVDAEVLHQRLRNVAHHAGLLLVGAAGGMLTVISGILSLPLLLLQKL